MTIPNDDFHPRPAWRFRLQMAPLSQSGQWAPRSARRRSHHPETSISDVIDELKTMRRVLLPAQYVAADGMWWRAESSTLLRPRSLAPVVTRVSHNSPIIVELLGSSVLAGLIVWCLNHPDKIGRFIPDLIRHWRLGLFEMELSATETKRQMDGIEAANRQLGLLGSFPDDSVGPEEVAGTAVADAMTKAVDEFRLGGGVGELIPRDESQDFLMDVRQVEDPEDFSNWIDNWE